MKEVAYEVRFDLDSLISKSPSFPTSCLPFRLSHKSWCHMREVLSGIAMSTK